MNINTKFSCYTLKMKKIILTLSLIILFCQDSYAVTNSSEAFLSLPFGHTYARTQKRMENSGATVLTPRKETLTMEGMFEGYPATFIFGFYKNKILKTKSVYLQSMGDKEYDRNFYRALQTAYNAKYGSGHEKPTANTRKSGKIMLRNIWTPNKYTTITLTYNSEASVKFPGHSMSDRFIQIIYKYSKWD